MRYIALDIGNVLCRIDFRQFTYPLSRHLNLSTWEVGRRINRSQKLRDVGLVSMSEILESEFNIKSNVVVEDFVNIWNTKVVKFDLDVLNFFQDQINDLRVALLSNVGIEHAGMIENFINSFPGLDVFKKSVRHYSCNVGVRKPQTLYYQSFLDQNPEFTGCVYLDDLPENLESASKLGFVSAEFNLEKITTQEELKLRLKAINDLVCETKEEKNSRWH